MTINRHLPGPRMSQAVVHGDTVYVCGQVADNADSKTVKEQTVDTLRKIDERLSIAGTDKSKLLSAQIWITDMAAFLIGSTSVRYSYKYLYRKIIQYPRKIKPCLY